MWWLSAGLCEKGGAPALPSGRASRPRKPKWQTTVVSGTELPEEAWGVKTGGGGLSEVGTPVRRPRSAVSTGGSPQRRGQAKTRQKVGAAPTRPQSAPLLRGELLQGLLINDHGPDQFLHKLERLELRRTKRELRCGYVDAKEFMARENGTGLTDLRVYHGRGQRAASEASAAARDSAAEASFDSRGPRLMPKVEAAPPSERVRDLRNYFDQHLQEVQDKVPKEEMMKILATFEKPVHAPEKEEETTFEQSDLALNFAQHFSFFKKKIATEAEVFAEAEEGKTDAAAPAADAAAPAPVPARPSSGGRPSSGSRPSSGGRPSSAQGQRRSLRAVVKQVEVLNKVEVVA
mmetsp:Transcript_56723/g.105017  ORF Transcript_56723/g.105017 Transcript_56723/m.105017 type:complete len:347 (-) Transcript_56723:55-1095(-)